MNKIVYFEWIDAESMDEWMSKDELEEWLNGDSYKVKSVGFLLSENKDYYLIVENSSKLDNYSMAMKIPKKMKIDR